MMKEMGHQSRIFCRMLPIAALLCVLIGACAPAKKTGTVVNDGTVTGIAIPKEGGLGRLVVELLVRLDDGTEVKAVWMEEQGKAKSMKGQKVEVEPTKDPKTWKVTRIL